MVKLSYLRYTDISKEKGGNETKQKESSGKSEGKRPCERSSYGCKASVKVYKKHLGYGDTWWNWLKTGKTNMNMLMKIRVPKWEKISE